MKRFSIAVLMMLLLGISFTGRLLAQEPAGSRPSLAILPLKEEGLKNLGDISDTMGTLVATAFTDSGTFQLVERSKVMAALPDIKLLGPEPDRAAIIGLGKRLDARFILMGAYLPEYNMANNSVTVTLTLRMVDAGDGTVFRNYQEVGAGASLGSVVASLTRQLSAKVAGSTKAVVPVVAAAPVQAIVPGVAAAPVMPAVPAEAVAPVKAAVPAEVSVPTVAAGSVRVPALEPAPASAPKAPQTLLVLREGKMNGIYYPKGGLARFGARLDDFDFLLKQVARLYPADLAVAFEIGGCGPADDVELNRDLVKKYHPEAMVILDLECRTRNEGHFFVLDKTMLQVEVQIAFLAPGTLGVNSAKSFQTEYLQAKSSRVFPSELKDQLAKRLALALPSLPN